MAPITLGDFFDSAGEHFAAAETLARDGLRDHGRAGRELLRLTRTMARYLGRIGPAEGGTGLQAVPGELVLDSMNDALREASTYLTTVVGAETANETPTCDPAVRHLAAAIDAIAAGADLFHSHFALDEDGISVPRSDWAPLLVSEPVVFGAVEEVAGWARHGVAILDRLTEAPGGVKVSSGSALVGARYCLAAVAKTTRPPGAASRSAGEDRELLRALPSVTPPDRLPLAEGESDEQLCAGIAVSAARLRAAAFTASRLPGDSPVLTGPSWKRAATAAAIISDIGRQATALLAGRSAALGQPPAMAESLRGAQRAFADASSSWLRSAWIWGAMSTDSQHPLSPCAIEAADLALRLGRLLYCDPAWTPARRRAMLRDSGRLAAGPSALARVLAAVHEAADALARMACADAVGISAVRREGRLYTDRQFLLDDRGGLRFVPALGNRVHLLNNAYYLCAGASFRAAAALDGPAIDAQTASKGLALRRAELGTPEAVAPETGYELDNAAFAERMEYFGQPRNFPLRHRHDVDASAIIRAYEIEKLPVREIADRFTMSLTSVRKLLEENGGTARERRRTAAQLAAMDGRHRLNPVHSPAPPAAPQQMRGTRQGERPNRGCRR